SRRTRRFEAWRLHTTEQREPAAETVEHVAERRSRAALPERAPAAGAAREEAAMQRGPSARHALELPGHRIAGTEELDELVLERSLRLVHVPLPCPLTRAAALSRCSRILTTCPGWSFGPSPTSTSTRPPSSWPSATAATARPRRHSRRGSRTPPPCARRSRGHGAV